MNTFDYLILTVLLIGFVRGLIKGFIVEVASFVALIGGVYGAIHFSKSMGEFLKNYIDWSQNAITLSAFAITFIGIVILVALAGKILTKIAKIATLGILNQLLGGLFGLFKFLLILCVVMNFFIKVNSKIPFVSQKLMETSILYEPIQKFSSGIFPTFIELKKEDPDVDKIPEEV